MKQFACWMSFIFMVIGLHASDSAQEATDREKVDGVNAQQPHDERRWTVTYTSESRAEFEKFLEARRLAMLAKQPAQPSDSGKKEEV